MCLFAAVICLLNVDTRLETTEQIWKIGESGPRGFESHGLKIQKMPKD